MTNEIITNEIINTTPAAIERIPNAQEAARISYFARAAAEFYRAKDDLTTAQHMKEIYIRSARKAGEFLLVVPREIGGDRKSTRYQSDVDLTPYQEALESTGVTEHIARVWQKIALIDAETLEQYITDPKRQHTEYTINGLLRYANGRNEGSYTPESMRKVITHWIKRYVSEFAGDLPALLADIRAAIGGEWR